MRGRASAHSARSDAALNSERPTLIRSLRDHLLPPMREKEKAETRALYPTPHTAKSLARHHANTAQIRPTQNPAHTRITVSREGQSDPLFSRCETGQSSVKVLSVNFATTGERRCRVDGGVLKLCSATPPQGGDRANTEAHGKAAKALTVGRRPEKRV